MIAHPGLPRDPRASDLWRLLDEHFDSFRQVYDEQFQAKYGFWRPVVARSVTSFLKCGDLQEGFARVRCPDCHHEMFVAFSCKQRCTCPSCQQKRTLLTALHVAEEVCAPVAHRQVVLTIPKRLRLHARFDRSLLGKLSHCAWTCIQAEVRRLLGSDDVVPGMIAAIQTHGELLHWHPHLDVLLTCGAFTSEGEFVELSELDLDQLEVAWQEAVFALYLAEEKIEPEVVENMRSWEHSGFSVDQSVLLPAGHQAGIERLVQYMTWCPFSLSRLVKVSDTGQVVYKAEKDVCRAFPDPQADGLESRRPAEFPGPFTAGVSLSSSLSTFHPRDLIFSATTARTRTRAEQCGRRQPRKQRASHPQLRGRRQAEAVRVGRSSLSESTRSTLCLVRNVGAR